MKSLSFLVYLIFANPAWSESIEFCRNPNAAKDKSINPMLPPSASSGTKLAVGYSCIVPTVETRAGKNEGYKPTGMVKWTLVRNNENKQVWAAHTRRWGPIFVGSIEPEEYGLIKAREVCNKYEDVVLEGVNLRISMTLPEIGFGASEVDNPLNFELLKSLNYMAVVPNENKRYFWSTTPNTGQFHRSAWAYDSIVGKMGYDPALTLSYSVRCLGR